LSKKISETLNNLRGKYVKAKACTAQTGGGAAGSTMPRDSQEASDDYDDADQQGRKYVWAEVVTTNTGLPGKVVEDPEVNDEGLIELAVELNEMAHSLFASRADVDVQIMDSEVGGAVPLLSENMAVEHAIEEAAEDSQAVKPAAKRRAEWPQPDRASGKKGRSSSFAASDVKSSAGQASNRASNHEFQQQQLSLAQQHLEEVQKSNSEHQRTNTQLLSLLAKYLEKMV
jgi:hypothetical protein